jgi:hypothetical protein
MRDRKEGGHNDQLYDFFLLLYTIPSAQDMAWR